MNTQTIIFDLCGVLLHNAGIDPDALAFLKLCKAQGVRLLILSNSDRQSFKFLVVQFPQLFSLFEPHDMFISDDLGCKKPDTACYAQVVDRAHLDLNHTFYVDDHLINVQAARAVGIISVHHRNWQETVEALEKAGLQINTNN